MIIAVVNSPIPWRFFVKRVLFVAVATFALTALAAKAADSAKLAILKS